MTNEEKNKTQNTSFGTEQKKENATQTTQFSSPEKITTEVSNPKTQTDSTVLNVDAAKETAKGLYSQAKDTVGQAYGVASKRAAEVIDEQKGTLAGGLTSVADSIKQVGDNLNTTAETNKITETAAKYTNSLAEQIEGVSNYFERKNVREMVSDVETFARKYPAYFVGGAVALGFLAARFLKSSPPKQLAKAVGQSFDNENLKPRTINPS